MGCLAAALLVVISAPSALAVAPGPHEGATARDWRASAPADYTSIFAHVPELANSGWSACVTPIKWTVDTGALSPAQSQRAIDDLRWALNAWAEDAGLVFDFTGTTPLTFDEGAFTLTPRQGGTPTGRHIFFSYVQSKRSTHLRGTTMGEGSPSSVVPADREIIRGTAIFRADYIETVSSQQTRSLYMHEIGHVLGLAHAQSRRNIMYPIVAGQVTLGPGDVDGIRAIAKPCRAASSTAAQP